MPGSGATEVADPLDLQQEPCYSNASYNQSWHALRRLDVLGGERRAVVADRQPATVFRQRFIGRECHWPAAGL